MRSAFERYEQGSAALLVNRAWCKGCTLCVDVCPSRILALDAAQLVHVSDIGKCIFCGLCEESCPVDAIVETRILEYHGETRGDLNYTKEMLLAVGDRYEEQIAKDRAADAAYR